MGVASELRRGMIIRHQDELHVVADFSEAQSGKQKPTVHVKLRNLRTGHTLDRTLEALGRIEEVPAEYRQMQYLYQAGQERVFMDSETFEQYSLGPQALGAAADYLVLEEQYRVLMVDDQPVSVELPETITMDVAETAPPAHAASTASNVWKEARLASGKVIRVPLFIKTGDRVRVDTQRGEYAGKES